MLQKRAEVRHRADTGNLPVENTVNLGKLPRFPCQKREARRVVRTAKNSTRICRVEHDVHTDRTKLETTTGSQIKPERLGHSTKRDSYVLRRHTYMADALF